VIREISGGQLKGTADAGGTDASACVAGHALYFQRPLMIGAGRWLNRRGEAVGQANLAAVGVTGEVEGKAFFDAGMQSSGE
jgi:hypothetical protein